MRVISLIDNSTLVAVDRAAWKLLGRKATAAGWAASLLTAAMAVVTLAAVMAVDVFALFHLLSFGLFGHFAFLLLLLLAAALLWRIPSPDFD